MKNILPAAMTILLSATLGFSQERPRYYDNFDSPGSVQISYTPSPQTKARRTAPAATDRVAVYINPMPPAAAVKVVKRTANVTMTVYDGYAQRGSPVRDPGPHLTMAAGKYMKGYSTGDDMIDSYIVDSSRRYNIDPLLIYAQMNQESSFKVRAKSNKGATGLMQLMPATARRMGVTDIYDPRQNIEGGIKYMRFLLDTFNGDVSLALAGYNAGEGAVIKYGYQIPPYDETQDYVKRISARYQSISYVTIASDGRKGR